MEKTNKIENYAVISTGELVEDFDSSTVITNLCSRFSINETTASQLLKPKTVLKKGISASYAHEYKQQLTKLGLVVNTINTSTSQQKPSKTTKTDTKLPSSIEDFESLFKSKIPEVKVSTKYKASLFLVILASLIAPVIYLSLLSGLVYSLFSYIVSLPGILSEISNATAILGAIIIPVFVPLVLFLFLIKPLFIFHEKPNDFLLNRNQFPALFNLVKVMCNKIGVPVPAQIAINNEINASASAQNGLLSLVRGQLKLTIGLPLITGMNIRQLSGVLAHEFGHFAQPIAMTAYYMVNSINYWFSNRAYEPDKWDERLEEWSEKADDLHAVISFAVMGAQLGIMLTRKLFGLLFLINYKTTQFMSRQMEYDADTYESIFSGSSQFENTAIQLRKLAYADQDIQEININAWNESQLLNNLPSAIAYAANSFDADIDDFIRQDMSESQTNSWDSHPADTDRINHVMNRNDPGIITVDFPAAELCRDIKKLSLNLTLHTYRRMGFNKPERFVIENTDILNSNDQKKKARASLDGFFNNSFNGRILNFGPISDTSAIPSTLDNTIETLRSRMIDYSRDNDLYQHLSEKLSFMIIGETFLNNSVDINATDFSLSSTEPAAIRKSIDTARDELVKLSKKLDTTDQLFFHRIKFDARLMNDTQLVSLKRNLGILKQIENRAESLSKLKVFHAILSSLSEDEELIEKLNNSINRYGKLCFEEAQRILNSTRKVPHNNKDFKSLYNFISSWCEVIPDQYDPVNLTETLKFSSSVSGAMNYHYYWVLAEVCELASSVEAENNITPIKLV